VGAAFITLSDRFPLDLGSLGCWIVVRDNPLMSPEADPAATRMYTLVVVCEVLAIGALWLLGRVFSA
jgi:hypothetical protein